MHRTPGLRTLGQLTAFGVAAGALAGAGGALILSLSLVAMGSLFGFVLVVFPAIAFGQAVGALTGFLAPVASRIALGLIRPRSLVGVRATVCVAVVILCAIPAAVVVSAVGLPLGVIGTSYPLAGVVIVVASVVVASITAWKLSPETGRLPDELAPSPRSRAGWWLIAIGVLPVGSVLSVYGAAWLSLNFTFTEEHAVIPPVAASLVSLLAVIQSVAAVTIAVGLTLAAPGDSWKNAPFVMFWAVAGLLAAAASSIEFWRLVGESLA